MVWRDPHDLHTVAWDVIPDRDQNVVGGRRSLRRLRSLFQLAGVASSVFRLSIPATQISETCLTIAIPDYISTQSFMNRNVSIRDRLRKMNQLKSPRYQCTAGLRLSAAASCHKSTYDTGGILFSAYL